MTFKQKLAGPRLLIMVLILTVAIILLFQFKKPADIAKSFGKIEQAGQNQTSQSAQDPTTEKSKSPIPLVSNLPSGVSASAISAVEGKYGSADVIAVSDGKTFSLVLEAKLADPPQGQFYAAWLAKSTGDKDSFKLGKLQKDKDSYSISFSQDGDFSSYKVAIVTLETNDDDRPETKILEGAL